MRGERDYYQQAFATVTSLHERMCKNYEKQNAELSTEIATLRQRVEGTDAEKAGEARRMNAYLIRDVEILCRRVAEAEKVIARAEEEKTRREMEEKARRDGEESRNADLSMEIVTLRRRVTEEKQAKREEKETVERRNADLLGMELKALHRQLTEMEEENARREEEDMIEEERRKEERKERVAWRVTFLKSMEQAEKTEEERLVEEAIKVEEWKTKEARKAEKARKAAEERRRNADLGREVEALRQRF